MDDKPPRNQIFFVVRQKGILRSQRLHAFFGGPKGSLMHLCGLKASHFFINYDINGQNLAGFPQKTTPVLSLQHA